jgi:hypothetical protein
MNVLLFLMTSDKNDAIDLMNPKLRINNLQLQF